MQYKICPIFIVSSLTVYTVKQSLVLVYCQLQPIQLIPTILHQKYKLDLTFPPLPSLFIFQASNGQFVFQMTKASEIYIFMKVSYLQQYQVLIIDMPTQKKYLMSGSHSLHKIDLLSWRAFMLRLQPGPRGALEAKAKQLGVVNRLGTLRPTVHEHNGKTTLQEFMSKQEQKARMKEYSPNKINSL